MPVTINGNGTITGIPAVVGIGTVLNNVLASRALATVYQNTSSSWRLVFARTSANSISIEAASSAGGLTTVFADNSAPNTAVLLVPPGWFYRVNGSGLLSWFES